MKKIALVVTSAVALCVLPAASAFASYGRTTHVHATTATHGTAFTGANISLGLVLLGALVVLGIGALVVSRRKAAATH